MNNFARQFLEKIWQLFEMQLCQKITLKQTSHTDVCLSQFPFLEPLTMAQFCTKMYTKIYLWTRHEQNYLFAIFGSEFEPKNN